MDVHKAHMVEEEIGALRCLAVSAWYSQLRGGPTKLAFSSASLTSSDTSPCSFCILWPRVSSSAAASTL